MFGRQPIKQSQTVGFLLTPQFSMIAFTAAIEPLRAANRISRQNLFTWQIFSIDGAPVKASNDVEFNPDGPFNEAIACDILFVCAGVRAYSHINPKVSGILRSLDRKGMPLGSVCTGSVALAEAGLLNGYRCTIHWENIESLAERYPKLNITATLFETDRNRFTCSGGMAALDMMIHSIQLDYGRELSMRVADQMLYTAIRDPQDLQRMAIEQRTGVTHPKLLAAVGYMETHLENMITMSDLADKVDISLRQMERLFRDKLGYTPAKFYHNLRLDRARALLRQTAMPVLEVAVATGFNSPSYFTKSYRMKFGYAPRQERDAA